MTQSVRLAVSSIAWESAEDEAVAALMRAQGCSGVEIAPTARWPQPLDATAAEIAAYRTWWEDRGLPIVAMQALLFGRPELRLFESEATRRALLDYMRGIIDLGASLGARSLVFGSPKNRVRGSLPATDAERIAVEFFRTLGEHAEPQGVVLCIEPNPAVYGSDFVLTTAEAVALCRQIDHPAIKVQGDIGAICLAGEDAEKVLRDNAPWIAHVHISEPQLAEIGTAGADHDGAARALRQIGYAGAMSIEMRKSAEGTHVDAVVRALEFVRAHYDAVLTASVMRPTG